MLIRFVARVLHAPALGVWAHYLLHNGRCLGG